MSIQTDSERCIENLREDVKCKSCNQVPFPEKLFKCPEGDLLCHTCIGFLLVQLPNKTMNPKCPVCGTDIDVTKLSYCCTVRNIIYRCLPFKCDLCNGEYFRKDYAKHIEGISRCKYSDNGCNWVGPHSDIPKHLETCRYSSKGQQFSIHGTL